MKFSPIIAIAVINTAVAMTIHFPDWMTVSWQRLRMSLLDQNGPHTQQTRSIPGDSPVDQCDVEFPQLLDIEFIDIDPNPPAKGKNLTINAAGTLHTPVTEGSYVEVEVRYGYIRLLRQTIDLCDQLANVNRTCPLDKGDLDLTKMIELPAEIPPGKYLALARAYTAEDEFITCLSAQVEFPAQL